MLASVDHFDVTRPLIEQSSFFGRQQDLIEVRRHLENRQHVGVFGLRKAGKSSLLNRISAGLKEHGWSVPHLDLNEFLGTPIRFKSGVVRAFQDELPRLSGNLRLRSTADSRRDIVNDYWLKDLESLIDMTPWLPGIVLVIDEVDTAIPARSLSRAEPEEEVGLLRALGQLRAFIQRRQSREQQSFVILCAGVDPALFERPKVRGIANPLYQFATVRFLSPLNRQDLADMVRTLGKRTGLRFQSHVLIDELLAEYGGHPLLTRQACSFIHRHRPAGVVPYQVEVTDLEQAMTATGPGTPYAHALDVPDAFAEWFPDEAAALAKRLEGSLTADGGSRELEHAVAYGILNEDGSVRMRALLRGPHR
jgi:hypothetical protein